MSADSKLTIIYPNPSGGVCIIYPNLDCGLTIQDIAEKDVPAGLPYVFVPVDAIPDHTFFEAFEVDFSYPNGKGLGAQAWFAKQETASKVN